MEREKNTAELAMLTAELAVSKAKRDYYEEANGKESDGYLQAVEDISKLRDATIPELEAETHDGATVFPSLGALIPNSLLERVAITCENYCQNVSNSRVVRRAAKLAKDFHVLDWRDDVKRVIEHDATMHSDLARLADAATAFFESNNESDNDLLAAYCCAENTSDVSSIPQLAAAAVRAAFAGQGDQDFMCRAAVGDHVSGAEERNLVINVLTPLLKAAKTQSPDAVCVEFEAPRHKSGRLDMAVRPGAGGDGNDRRASYVILEAANGMMSEGHHKDEKRIRQWGANELVRLNAERCLHECACVVLVLVGGNHYEVIDLIALDVDTSQAVLFANSVMDFNLDVNDPLPMLRLVAHMLRVCRVEMASRVARSGALPFKGLLDRPEHTADASDTRMDGTPARKGKGTG